MNNYCGFECDLFGTINLDDKYTCEEVLNKIEYRSDFFEYMEEYADNCDGVDYSDRY